MSNHDADVDTEGLPNSQEAKIPKELLKPPGLLFVEREWPKEGDLQLQDGLDIACRYCKTESHATNVEFTKSEFADRRYDTTDLLWKHVAEWHIDCWNGPHREVDLKPLILCRDGVTERQPEPEGLAVPTLQKEAAKRAGWKPNFPTNVPIVRELPQFYDEVRAEPSRQFYLYDELPRQQLKAAASKADNSKPNEYSQRGLREFEESPLYSDRDVYSPGMVAFVEYQNGTRETISYGDYLRWKAHAPIALRYIGDRESSVKQEFRDLVLSHQMVLVQTFKFEHGMKDWVIVKEEWMEYGTYRAKKDKFSQWKAVIKEIKDGLGFRNAAFEEVIKESQKEAEGWWKYGVALNTEVVWQRGR